jgi:sugar lactone lactonase YvrE
MSHNPVQPKVILDVKAQLGEGAIWHPLEKKLYWVDIEGKLLHVFNPATGLNSTYNTFGRIGTVVPARGGGALVALQNGIAQIDLLDGKIQGRVDPEKDLPGNRFNDGKCDPQGRLWVGSMSLDAKTGAGSVYRIDHDFLAQKMISEVTISNGICWSLDGLTMYYIDTPTRQVVAYGFDSASGNISNPEVIINVEKHLGFPDGMTIDSRGMLWIALWGGGAVGCWDPRTGDLLDLIKLPAPNVTSCAFGGENLNQLFITTAREGLTKKELEMYSDSGSLFMVETSIHGIPAFLFG